MIQQFCVILSFRVALHTQYPVLLAFVNPKTLKNNLLLQGNNCNTKSSAHCLQRGFRNTSIKHYLFSLCYLKPGDIRLGM